MLQNCKEMTKTDINFTYILSRLVPQEMNVFQNICGQIKINVKCATCIAFFMCNLTVVLLIQCTELLAC